MQKQTNPKPLGASMAKLVLVVAIIAFIGAVLGVAGYLIMNKPQINLPVVITPPSAEGKVAITTDKTEYEQGEIVEIIVINGLDFSIMTYSFMPDKDKSIKFLGENYGIGMIERLENGVWIGIEPVWRCGNSCFKKCLYLHSFEPGEKRVFEWNQTILICDVVNITERVEYMGAGKYRISSAVRIDKEKIYKTIYSNEFTIKEKDETANRKTYRNEEYGFEFKYPDNFTIEEPVSDVAIVRSEGKEYLQVQYFYLISTPPRPENYMPNSASFIGTVNIGNKKADKYYTVKPQGEGGVIENTPYTNYVITLGDKEWIQIDYYGEKEVASSFEKILSTFKFIDRDETLEWQTYSNKKFGYEVKYPKDWYVYDDDPAKVYFQKGKEEDISFETQPFGPHFLAFQIGVSESILNVSLQEWALKDLKESYGFGTVIKSEEEITIGNATGIKVIPECEDLNCEYPAAYISKDSKVFKFDEQIIFDEQISGESEVFNQILSTFKFIEKEE